MGWYILVGNARRPRRTEITQRQPGYRFRRDPGVRNFSKCRPRETLPVSRWTSARQPRAAAGRSPRCTRTGYRAGNLPWGASTPRPKPRAGRLPRSGGGSAEYGYSPAGRSAGARPQAPQLAWDDLVAGYKAGEPCVGAIAAPPGPARPRQARLPRPCAGAAGVRLPAGGPMNAAQVVVTVAAAGTDGL